MPFGIALRDEGLSVSDLCALARVADDAGLDIVLFPDVGSRDSLVLAALAGASTRRIRVGTGVLPVSSRSAAAIALGAAAAADASGGRFVCGLGAGSRATCEAWYSNHWNHPRTRLKETAEVLRRILSGERVSHRGTFTLDGFHLRSAPPPVPVYLGALTPSSLRLAGAIADAVILNWLPLGAVRRTALLAREAAADAGRRIDVLGYVRVALAETTDEVVQARQALADQVYDYAHLPAYMASLHRAGFGSALEAIFNGDDRGLGTLVDALCLCGDAKTLRDGLEAYARAGLDVPVGYPVAYGDEPAASVLRTIRALGGA